MMAQRSAAQVRAILADHGSRGPEYALVECIRCDASARVEQSARMSDAELVARFEALGWSIGPTLCPAHVSEPHDATHDSGGER